MSTIPDLSSVPEALRTVIQQRANAARMRSLDVANGERALAEMVKAIAAARRHRDDALLGLNIHLCRAGFEVGQDVEILGELYRRGTATASYLGAIPPDSEPEEPTADDLVAEYRAAFADATRVS